MSFSPSHPALYGTGYHKPDADPIETRATREILHERNDHFVPEGWEETDRGVCPCGELVRWNDIADLWVPDRTLVLFVLTEEEAKEALGSVESTNHIQLDRELALQMVLNRRVEEPEEVTS